MTRSDIIVTRSEPGGSAFAARLHSLGYEAACVPLLAAQGVDDPAPQGDADAMIMTSAHALPYAAAYRQKPVYTVGAGTAEAARQNGWTQVIEGPGDVAQLAALLPRDKTFLHLSGAVLAPGTQDAFAGLNVQRQIVYRTVPTGLEDRLFKPASPTLITLHSPQAAAICGAYVRAYPDCMPNPGIIFLCLSQGVLESFGNHPAGTPRLYAVDTPTEDALIERIGSLI